MIEMKTRYSTPDITIILVSPAVLSQTSFDSHSYREGNAQTMAASRESDSLWDDDE